MVRKRPLVGHVKAPSPLKNVDCIVGSMAQVRRMAAGLSTAHLHKHMHKHIFASLIALSSLWSSAAAAAEPILIGQSASLSGPAAAAGQAFVLGARLYLNEVNGSGGINGRPIELRTLDDSYDPKRAADNAAKLIDSGAVGLFGFVNTPTSLAGAKVATENRMPFIAPASGASGLRERGNDYIFNVRASFKDEASRIATHLATVSTQRVSFFSLLIPESKTVYQHLEGRLAQSGQKFYSVANVEPGKVDLVKAAADLQPTQTQAVVMFCPGKMCADLVAEVRRQGGSGISFYTISSAGDVFGPAAEMGATVAVTQVMPYPWVPGAFPIVDKYQKAMLAAGHPEFSYWSLEGYISAAVLTEGLRRMKGSPSPAALTAAMRSIDRLHLGGFELTMNAQHHDGSTYTDITLARSSGRYRR
jgi:branched-chain amino acid transport system substrate-binding protein